MAYPQLFEVRSDKIYFDGYEVAQISDAGIPCTVKGEFIDCLEEAELPEEDITKKLLSLLYHLLIGAGIGLIILAALVILPFVFMLAGGM